MSDMGQILTDYGPWIGGAGTVITLAALVFAFWAWARPKKGRLLCAVNDDPLGLPADENLEVRYRGELVESPRIVTVTLVVGNGTDLTPSNFTGGHLSVRGHGIDVLGPIGNSPDGSRVLDGDSSGPNDGATILMEPCIVQAGAPLELSFLACWREGWKPDPIPPGREVTTSVRAGLSFLSAEITSTVPTGVEQQPFFEVDAKLANFKVVTPAELAERRGRLTDRILSAAAVGRL